MLNTEIFILGKQIGRARKLARMSQKDLAEKLFVSDKTISAYESGRAIPPVPTLKKIADLTNQPIDMFFQNNDESGVGVLNIKLDTILEEIEQIKKHLGIK